MQFMRKKSDFSTMSQHLFVLEGSFGLCVLLIAAHTPVWVCLFATKDDDSFRGQDVNHGDLRVVSRRKGSFAYSGSRNGRKGAL